MTPYLVSFVVGVAVGALFRDAWTILKSVRRERQERRERRDDADR